MGTCCTVNSPECASTVHMDMKTMLRMSGYIERPPSERSVFCPAREESRRQGGEDKPAIQRNQQERRRAGGLWFSRRQFLQSAAAAAAGLIALNQTAKVGAESHAIAFLVHEAIKLSRAY